MSLLKKGLEGCQFRAELRQINERPKIDGLPADNDLLVGARDQIAIRDRRLRPIPVHATAVRRRKAGV